MRLCFQDHQKGMFLWSLCRDGVWAVPGRNACQMLPIQAAKAALSWCEPTGIQISIFHYIHVHTCTYQYVLVCTSIYQNRPLPVHTSTYHYILVCTSIYQYIPVHTSIYWYVLVCAGIFWYLLLIFTLLFQCWGAGVCAGHHCRGPAISFNPYNITEDIDDVSL